jgi:hypothetical protein
MMAKQHRHVVWFGDGRLPWRNRALVGLNWAFNVILSTYVALMHRNGDGLNRPPDVYIDEDMHCGYL